MRSKSNSNHLSFRRGLCFSEVMSTRISKTHYNEWFFLGTVTDLLFLILQHVLRNIPTPFRLINDFSQNVLFLEQYHTNFDSQSSISATESQLLLLEHYLRLQSISFVSMKLSESPTHLTNQGGKQQFHQLYIIVNPTVILTIERMGRVLALEESNNAMYYLVTQKFLLRGPPTVLMLQFCNAFDV